MFIANVHIYWQAYVGTTQNARWEPLVYGSPSSLGS